MLFWEKKEQRSENNSHWALTIYDERLQILLRLDMRWMFSRVQDDFGNKQHTYKMKMIRIDGEWRKREKASFSLFETRFERKAWRIDMSKKAKKRKNWSKKIGIHERTEDDEKNEIEREAHKKMKMMKLDWEKMMDENKLRSLRLVYHGKSSYPHR